MWGGAAVFHVRSSGRVVVLRCPTVTAAQGPEAVRVGLSIGFSTLLPPLPPKESPVLFMYPVIV